MLMFWEKSCFSIFKSHFIGLSEQIMSCIPQTKSHDWKKYNGFELATMVASVCLSIPFLNICVSIIIAMFYVAKVPWLLDTTK